MIQRTKQILMMTLVGLLFALTGCGGGGETRAVTTTKVGGVASKGIISGGTVNIYALDANGAKTGPPLASVQTATDGTYSADLGSYSGPVKVEVTGTYTDEATGLPVTIGTNNPMRAMVANVIPRTDPFTATVSPLTDLAVSSLPTSFNTAAITAANAQISGLFKVSDITTVKPVAPTKIAMDGATTDQQAYTLALATVSQMAKTNSGGATPTFTQVTTVLTDINTELKATPTELTNTAKKFTDGLTEVTKSGATLTGYTAANAVLGTVGVAPLKLTVAVANAGAYSVQGDIVLPLGSSVRIVNTVTTVVAKDLLGGIFTAGSGAAGAYTQATLTPPSGLILGSVHFNVVTTGGFTGTDVAILIIDVSSSTTKAADFILQNVKVTDVNSAAVASPQVTLK